MHLTCLNHSKFEICELLEELRAADIDSILALRGDANPAVEAKEDFRYASDLVKFIRQYGDFSISGACLSGMPHGIEKQSRGYSPI